MAWETFQRNKSVEGGPTATIDRRGIIAINQSSRRALNDPEAIRFLWDGEERLIGLVAASTDEPGAYVARRDQRGYSVKFSGTAFLQYYGIDYSTARRFSAYMDDGVLCIDLKTEGQPVTSNRARKAVGE